MTQISELRNKVECTSGKSEIWKIICYICFSLAHVFWLHLLDIGTYDYEFWPEEYSNIVPSYDKKHTIF